MRWEEIDEEPMGPGISRRVIHGKNITLARIYLDAGTTVPEHKHDNEQISYVIEGRLVFEIRGNFTEATEGEIIMIPPKAPHRVIAKEPSVVLDTFSPPRKDWIEGKDDYLRG